MSDVQPLVGIVMGSKSDWPVMSQAVATLDSLGIPHEVRVLSAHRTPDAALAYSQGAAERGIKVLIGAAGLAAHLSGVLAAGTLLPVIGVPMAGGVANGLDALLSTVQMPKGIPVATVAIGGARNAALLAGRILALTDPAIADAVAADRQAIVDEASTANEAVQAEWAERETR